MLILVESKFASYHHVVAVWREMVIDYESMYTYPLTEETLSKFAVSILPFNESAVGTMASYHQQFVKHLREISIVRTGAWQTCTNQEVL
jgi:hypothetical protein